MKGMDLASALAPPVQGRGSGQGARSRPEAGHNDAESFDTVFNDVHGVAATSHRQTDDAGAGSAADGTAQDTDYASAAVQNPAAVPGNDGVTSAGSAGQATGHAAGGLADQPTPLTLALGLPVQDGQAPSAAPGTETATPGPDPRLAVPGALVAATVQTSAFQTGTPGIAPTPGLQPITAPPVTALSAGVPPAAAGGVPAVVNSAASTFTPQGSAADQTLSMGAISGATSGVASGRAETNPLEVPATGVRSAVVLGNAPAPVTAPTTAGTSSTTTATAAASAVLPTNVAAAGNAAGFPAAALAEGGSSGAARPGDTTAPAPAAPADALTAAGAAVAAVAPAGQPTSSTAAAPQPAAPAAPQPGATIQPQLAKPLFTLAGAPQGQHIMTLQVTPEDLGPMTVRAHIDAAGVRIELFAPGDAGREAIRGVLPELRKELADAGFGASLDVSEHTGPGNTARDGTSQDNASGDRAGRESGSGPGNRNGPGDPRPGHRWDALADGDALRDARILNGPQTTLDILV